MGSAIGGAGTPAPLRGVLQHNPAIAMERFLDQMPASGAAEEPIAPAAVSGGKKASRRGITLGVVLKQITHSPKQTQLERHLMAISGRFLERAV